MMFDSATDQTCGAGKTERPRPLSQFGTEVHANNLPSDHALAVVHDSLDALIASYQRRRETLSGVGYGRSRISIALWTVAADGGQLP